MWSLVCVLSKATIRGARDSHVMLMYGLLCGTKQSRRLFGNDYEFIFMVSGWPCKKGHDLLVMLLCLSRRQNRGLA